jgi:hypothetical protein
MNEQRLVSTRRALHGVAELILAGPQYRLGGGIRLRVVPGGFGTTATPDLRVDGDLLVTPGGTIELSAGTFAERAKAAGVQAGRLDDVYSGGAKTDLDSRIDLDRAPAASWPPLSPAATPRFTQRRTASVDLRLRRGLLDPTASSIGRVGAAARSAGSVRCRVLRRE